MKTAEVLERPQLGESEREGVAVGQGDRVPEPRLGSPVARCTGVGHTILVSPGDPGPDFHRQLLQGETLDVRGDLDIGGWRQGWLFRSEGRSGSGRYSLYGRGPRDWRRLRGLCCRRFRRCRCWRRPRGLLRGRWLVAPATRQRDNQHESRGHAQPDANLLVHVIRTVVLGSRVGERV